MTKTLQTTALAALLMSTVYGGQAVAHSAVELKKDIQGAVNICKGESQKLESYSCLFVWVRDTLDTCKRSNKPQCAEVEKQSNELPYATYQDALKKYDAHVNKEERAMNLVVAQVTLGHKSAEEAYKELSPRLEELKKDCSDAFTELNEETTPLWDLYGEMKGRTCRK